SSGKEPPSAEPLPCAACPEGWIGFGSKCFYFSDDTRNWTSSQQFCASEKANLTHIDSQKEMDFLERYADRFAHWIGLSRESSNDPWEWVDNAGHNVWYVWGLPFLCVHVGLCLVNLSLLFGFRFNVTGDEDYAYLNKGVSSGRGYAERKWICSKPNNYADKCQVHLNPISVLVAVRIPASVQQTCQRPVDGTAHGREDSAGPAASGTGLPGGGAHRSTTPPAPHGRCSRPRLRQNRVYPVDEEHAGLGRIVPDTEDRRGRAQAHSSLLDALEASPERASQQMRL
ncbi:C-type lectin domain family 2 member D11, partial [Galemys pyrenaicus]